MNETEFLRHAVATVAYRAGKAVRGAPAAFASFESGPGTRVPAAIVAHVGDLYDWALAMAEGREAWHDSTPLPWDDEVRRLFAALAAFDTRLASGAPLAVSAQKLFQGPIADSLTHVGQLAMLRRMAGAAVRGENYARAEIVTGRVGVEQATPRREFD
jgi:hypothetical protein